MDGFPSLGLHGDKSQQERDWVLAEFKKGSHPIMIATDVAARGLGKPEERHSTQLAPHTPHTPPMHPPQSKSPHTLYTLPTHPPHAKYDMHTDCTPPPLHPLPAYLMQSHSPPPHTTTTCYAPPLLPTSC